MVLEEKRKRAGMRGMSERACWDGGKRRDGMDVGRDLMGEEVEDYVIMCRLDGKKASAREGENRILGETYTC